MAKTEIKKVEPGQVPAFMQESIGEVAGMGNSTSASDNTLPFLAIIQKGSPQLDRQKPEYIPEAKEGMLIDTATSDIWDGDEGLEVIPFAYQKNFVEWVPREDGGGYVATHPFDLDLARKMGGKRDDKQRVILPSGNQLVETAYTFVFVPSVMAPMIIGASSTALRPMRDWMSKRNRVYVGGKQAPAFARSYLAKTVYNSNDAGSWYNWKIADVDWVQDPELFQQMLNMAKSAAAGEMQIGRPPEDLDSADSDGDDGIPV